ncbi:response regulator [Shewanella amazonensis]|uniref:Response regulator receiver protein n=1 Tax=Shewanella amazonensis (strain ATCC BAA-1098 / SB2B) TaxID=326297 RepID=A1S4K5_SHEAM|nr:response regulator [Shewanella amazonensis]ABL99311.1 response regulator receiver protein [Shewanella amazonensis SB2B]
MTHKVFIVEDEKNIAEVMQMYLQAEGLETRVFHDGSDVVEAVKNETPSLMLLDLMLPGKDGLSICQELRVFSELYIIMTTARVEEVDRLLGLDTGADDYVCKPYSARELTARVRAVLRRLDGKLTAAGTSLKVDESGLSISFGGQTVVLTALEFRLFNLLYSQPNRIYSRSQILDLLYSDFRVLSDRTVDSHIRNLRKKLTGLNTEQEMIRSIYGLGYRFEG